MSEKHNEKYFESFEEKIGFTFSNKNLLKQAFIHRSYLNENPSESLSHNERLEFLGDAVLELVITEYLYAKYPQKDEGDLTALRAALVNANSLSLVGSELGMDDYLLLSKGETKGAGRARHYIIANTFEALVGALYLDAGYDTARAFIQKFLTPQVDSIIKNRTWQDAKSLFQERAQDEVGVTPSYAVLNEVGPDHDKVFTVGVYLGDEKIAEGSGRSKQEAEQDSARNALTKKKWKSA
jgi:ribonuclease-3